MTVENKQVPIETGPLVFSLENRDERLAKFSIWGISVAAVMLSLLAFVAGATTNSTAGHWLFSFFMLPFAPLSCVGFVLAIARYRHSRVAIGFTLTCFGLLVLINLAGVAAVMSKRDTSSHESIGLLATLNLFFFSALVSEFCQLTLRIGQGLKHWYSRHSKPEFKTGTASLFRVPKSKRLIYAIFVLWGGLFINLLLTIQSASARIDGKIGIGLLKDLMLVPGTGAVASELPFLIVLTVAVVVVFTASTCFVPFRSPKRAKICVAIYLAISLIVMFIEPWIALNNASKQLMRLEAISPLVVEGTRMAVTELPKHLVSKRIQMVISLPVAIGWSVYTIAIWKAITKDLKASPVQHRSSNKRYPIKNYLTWAWNEFLPKLRTGTLSMAMTYPLVLMLLIFIAHLLSGNKKGGSLEVFTLSVLLATCFPLPGTVAIVVYKMWKADQSQRMSWQPWELASRIWLWNLLPTFSVIILSTVLFVPLAFIALIAGA